MTQPSSERTIYDDIFDALKAHTFSIANVAIREPFEDTAKTYPLIVVHEIINMPRGRHATVTGEGRTTVSYQLDIQTQNCRDTEGNALTKYRAARVLSHEVTALLDTMKVTRRNLGRGEAIAPDVVQQTWRGDAVLDSEGYIYRR